MSGYSASNRERERPAAKGPGRGLLRAKLASTLTEDLRQELSKTRRAYRIKGEETGRRAGMVAITTIWWRRWLEFGIDHELRAREGFQQLLARQAKRQSAL